MPRLDVQEYLGKHGRNGYVLLGPGMVSFNERPIFNSRGEDIGHSSGTNDCGFLVVEGHGTELHIGPHMFNKYFVE